ncbi:hypothetical protein GOODEAATRI_027885 [Goodea atripinnis]|uniref:Uncharacterized protein n=1 Tax=Goodea atripinnis TaxID=208336 RepID=A0ABV0Q1Q6_9TELE
MSFATKETLARLSLQPASQRSPGWKRQDVARAMLLFGQRRHRKSAVTPFPDCAGSRLMQFILKVPGKSVLAFHVITMAVGPNNWNSLGGWDYFDLWWLWLAG